MPSKTNHFYELIAGFSDFSEFPNAKWYQPLPEDWSVVITDVRGSTKAIEQGEYKQNLIVNTDYRKFDELLRMVISGTKVQRQQLRSILEDYRDKGKIVFGIHEAPSALITCIVTNYDKDHVHFLDGADGGYAMAAREMKQQLK